LLIVIVTTLFPNTTNEDPLDFTVITELGADNNAAQYNVPDVDKLAATLIVLLVEFPISAAWIWGYKIFSLYSKLNTA